ncbi:MAG: HutD family protein [Betaproteobacteria bacterium]|nr:HutD family protein [Betaproteobacteria bacterium]
MIRLLHPLAYRAQPWKNGGGTTTEIAVHPEGAGWDDFLWRIGIADIRQSGPFSSFPGIDRSILLLDCPVGSGMTLTIDGTSVRMIRGNSSTSPARQRPKGRCVARRCAIST